MRIDAHQHFWRYGAELYPWMSAEMRILKRDWLPEDLRPLLDAQRIDACIAVQARAQEDETDSLLTLAERHAWIGGVVGWVDLNAVDFDRRIERWAHAKKLVGFRHQLQDEHDVVEFVARNAVNRAIATLQRSNRIYELLVFARQLPALAKFCATHDSHTLVLDHLGKPSIRTHDHASWQRDIAALAALPHVVCKLSGLVTEAADSAGKFSESELHRYLDTALELFGPERLMFGSDWPVCLLAARYEEVVDVVERWCARLSAPERSAIWGETAQRIYGLEHS